MTDRPTRTVYEGDVWILCEVAGGTCDCLVQGDDEPFVCVFTRRELAEAMQRGAGFGPEVRPRRFTWEKFVGSLAVLYHNGVRAVTFDPDIAAESHAFHTIPQMLADMGISGPRPSEN